MKKETILRKIKENFYEYEVYAEDEKCIAIRVQSVSTKVLSWMRLPYVMITATTDHHIILWCYYKF